MRSWSVLRALVLLALLVLPGGTWAAAQDDGPYVLWEGRAARVLRVREGRLQQERLLPPYRLVLPGLAAEPLQLNPAQPSPARADFPQPERVLAVSDLHGAFEAVVALLKAQGVVDGDLRWRFGRGHLVVLGDVFDRRDKVTELLWFLRALEPAAERAGGRVHLLLGNHEAMVLRGDLRYLHPKYEALARIEGAGTQPVLYGPESELGRWLRSRPAVLRLGPYLFVHGGISPGLGQGGTSLEALNAAVRRGLDASRPDPDQDFAHGPLGPLWYRGLLPGMDRARECPPEALAPLLKTLGASTIVVGHTTLGRITAFHGGRVYGIDAGFQEGKPGEAWILDQGKVLRGLPDGRREAF
jgi:hypothetical protein